MPNSRMIRDSTMMFPEYSPMPKAPVRLNRYRGFLTMEYGPRVMRSLVLWPLMYARAQSLPKAATITSTKEKKSRAILVYSPMEHEGAENSTRNTIIAPNMRDIFILNFWLKWVMADICPIVCRIHAGGMSMVFKGHHVLTLGYHYIRSKDEISLLKGEVFP